MKKYQGSEAFIEVLNANGIEHIFFNPGGEMGLLQVSLLKYRATSNRAPKMIMCLHESVALTAAHGHYMVSGKPQVVMVHSELGTQQVGGALHNAQWGRIPVVLMAGVQASPQRTNWKNEPYDQGLMARNSVKWDHECRDDEDIHDVIQRAIDVAMTEPRGPVYLTYKRELFSNIIEQRSPESYQKGILAMPPTDRRGLEKIADALLEAENPLIMAGYNSRYPETVRSLIELAETAGIPVMPGLTRMNFPTTHPLCAGMEEMGGGIKGNVPLTEADVVLAIDYDLPYVPANGMPKQDAIILQIDVDPLTVGRPLWGHGASVFTKADSREAIPALTRLIKEKLTPEKKARIRDRVEQLDVKHKIEREERHVLAINQSEEKPITPDWLCYNLNKVLDEDTILVNHLISQSSSVPAQIDRSKPGTLLACAGGSIMWALGAAIGAKVAAPEKTVISLITDGGFTWGCPEASLWSAFHHKAPFLTVIFDNQSYGVIRKIVETMSETRLSDELGKFVGVDIAPPPDYAKIAEACNGYGRTVEEPADVLPTLKEALWEVRNGKIAVVDVRLAKGLSGSI
jgi:acetolactate synthase-1/2/3 large subunit